MVGTRRGEIYVVGCPAGSTSLYALGPLERPQQPLLQGKTGIVDDLNLIVTSVCSLLVCDLYYVDDTILPYRFSRVWC